MIEPGHILDKYELLEKVGRGGMAVVYRALDTALQRHVAIKVLHAHLAENQEARDRFEREAHAVAKLRHKNIVEIFDYSGTALDGSYIVTEFIDGDTLKQFITEHALRYAELGAMIVVQVCKALAHAHQFGILHRDIKPENIMIRSDGVIKLMDFGIAQILDTQRLTMTGQLLGSPAYMSPEHVLGQPLDVRTDVFAVGIVLYQLSTGQLPFSGNNPHAILKRIADCQYEPPARVQPRTSRQLANIIDTAMARDPDNRYADVTQMLDTLESYLHDSGIIDIDNEIARFFASPTSYETALGERLIANLSAAGTSALRHNRVAALEYFNRVLTIDPSNTDVLATIHHLSHRSRKLRAVAAVGVAILICTGATWVVHAKYSRDVAPSANTMDVAPSANTMDVAPSANTMDVAPSANTMDVAPSANTSGTPPAENVSTARTITQTQPRFVGESPIETTVATTRLSDAAPPSAVFAPRVATRIPSRRPRSSPRSNVLSRVASDASTPPIVSRALSQDATPAHRTLNIRVRPRQWTEGGIANPTQIRVDDGPWRNMAGPSMTIELPPGPHVIHARNDACCISEQKYISAIQPGGTLGMSLPMKTGALVLVCNSPDVRVTVDGTPQRIGANVPVFFANTTRAQRNVEILFIGPNNHVDQHNVTVRPNQAVTVQCTHNAQPL